MKTALLAAAIAASLAVFASSEALAAKAPTPMELQALQQKEFEADKSTVFGSVVSVFQDLGYTLNTADIGSGFVVAESATTNKTNIFEALGGMSGSGNTRATAFIEPMASGNTRVRLNFVSTKALSGLYGQNARQDKPILDAATYQRAFEKIDEAIFVRKATNSPPPTPAPPAASTPPAPAAQAPAVAPPAPVAQAAPVTAGSAVAPRVVPVAQASTAATKAPEPAATNAVAKQCGMVRQPSGAVRLVPC